MTLHHQSPRRRVRQLRQPGEERGRRSRGPGVEARIEHVSDPRNTPVTGCSTRPAW